jgi:porin
VERTQIAELWYEHLFLDERLRLKVGKVDLNTEFVFVDGGGEFTNPSSGISPAIVSAPSYPDPATSVNLFYTHTSGWTLGLGVYDGAANEGVSTGSVGPSTFFGAPSDLFLIGELVKRWTLGDEQAAGRIGFGLWKHTGTFDEFDGGQSDGTEGFYLMLDQELWRENPGQADDTQGLAAYLMAFHADEDVSEIETHLGLGLVRTGLFDCCEADVCGVCLNWVGLSEQAGFSADDELNVELFFKHQLCGWCSIKPDLQFISNPGGDSSADDVWVAAVRLEFGI